MQNLISSPSQTDCRWTHPLAWWAWGLAAALVAMTTSNVLLHAIIFGSVFIVILAKRSNQNWSASAPLLIRLAIFIIAFRIFIELIFGVHFGGPILFTLPTIELPTIFGGILLGGKIGTSGLIAAALHGFKLATVVVAAAAPAALVPTSLVLKSLPNSVYEAGLVTVIAIGFLPALTADAKRIRTAARLRGNSTKSLSANAKLIFPLLDSALNRAATLANAMESKGFGKTKSNQVAPIKVTLILSAGLALLILVSFSLLRNPLNIMNLLTLTLALSLISMAVIVSNNIRIRTKYKKPIFGKPELAMLLTAFVLIGLIATNATINIGVSILVGILLISPMWITPKIPTGFAK